MRDRQLREGAALGIRKRRADYRRSGNRDRGVPQRAISEPDPCSERVSELWQQAESGGARLLLAMGDRDSFGRGSANCGPTFFCRCCAVTVSCLPHFAQPYRIVSNSTIEAFFESSGIDRVDVQRWGQLLGRYRQAYHRWCRTLRMECGALSGRSPPEEKPLIFWHRIMEACGGLASATGKLVGQLRITLFGRYRCHQRRIFRA